MYEEHEIFIKPEDPDIKIWRYMDFSKLLSLLDKKALFFSRADKLIDPFEGSFSCFNVEMRSEVYKGKIPQENLNKIYSIFKKFREYTLINCWHMNDFESFAMWKLYSANNQGIAIQSTFTRLTECFKLAKETVFIGKVKYIDYTKDWMPEGNTMYPFIHKRKSFEYENELRALIQSFPTNDKAFDFCVELFKNGSYIDVDIHTLIQNVYVCPTAPDWFLDLVMSSIKQYGFEFKVIKSSLNEDPVW
jgi:ssDNA-specific exonuclease RecJ